MKLIEQIKCNIEHLRKKVDDAEKQNKHNRSEFFIPENHSIEKIDFIISGDRSKRRTIELVASLLYFKSRSFQHYNSFNFRQYENIRKMIPWPDDIIERMDPTTKQRILRQLEKKAMSFFKNHYVDFLPIDVILKKDRLELIFFQNNKDIQYQCWDEEMFQRYTEFHIDKIMDFARECLQLEQEQTNPLDTIYQAFEFSKELKEEHGTQFVAFLKLKMEKGEDLEEDARKIRDLRINFIHKLRPFNHDRFEYFIEYLDDWRKIMLADDFQNLTDKFLNYFSKQLEYALSKGDLSKKYDLDFAKELLSRFQKYSKNVIH